jgi:hypothetical protein
MAYTKPVIAAENKAEGWVKGPTCWDKEETVMLPKNCEYMRD